MITFDEYRILITEEAFEKALLGDTKTVTTLGVITAENPFEKKYVKQTNERRNQELEDYLRKKGFEPIPVKGRFMGRAENPYLVLNISRDQLIELGNRFQQTVVLFGKKHNFQNKKTPRFEFSYIVGDRTHKKGKLRFEHPDEKNDMDSYITLGGQKYTIRFS